MAKISATLMAIKLKSRVYKFIKEAGFTTAFLKVNYVRKKLLGLKLPHYNELTSFYRTFIKPGDLVFDIGANVGHRSEIFHKLGGKLVCLEPNTKLFDVLRFKFGNSRDFTILNVACGEKKETKEFKIASNHLVSSLSDKFIEHKKSVGEDRKWDISVPVQITTLDDLVSQYGAPDFCKIDVEGYEKEVLKGLSKKVGSISFEFTSPTFNQDTIWCIRKLAQIGYTAFNISFGESLKLELKDWTSAEALVTYITEDHRLQAVSYGDVYAK